MLKYNEHCILYGQNIIIKIAYFVFFKVYQPPSVLKMLKVPKCENFHRTDFFYFYTIKPLWVGDFRAKIKKLKIVIFRGSFWGFFFENFVLAHTECAQNFFF